MDGKHLRDKEPLIETEEERRQRISEDLEEYMVDHASARVQMANFI